LCIIYFRHGNQWRILFWVKKEKSQKEEKPTGQAKQSHQALSPPTPLQLKVWIPPRPLLSSAKEEGSGVENEKQNSLY